MQFSAKVIKGRSIGKKLGFPTLNFEIPEGFSLGKGVYACKIVGSWQLAVGRTEQYGVLFFGTRKTFGYETALEVHLLDTELEKTPTEATIEVLEKIRNPKKFVNQAELKKAIQNDCDIAKKIITE